MAGRSVARSSKKGRKRIRNVFFSLARSTQLATMADALLSIAVEKLTQVLGRELLLFAGARHELEKLRDTFQSIQALLADAERRQAADESVRLWLSRLRAVAYDIDDLLLDDWMISGLEEEEEAEAEHGRNKISACLLSPFTTVDHVASRYTIARRITEIRKRLDHIDGEKNRYSFSSSSDDGQGQLVSKRPYTGSFIEEVMIGRDQDKAEIINRLEYESSSENGQVQVIAIVGIAGLGKTTLAREIYNDSSLCKHFDLFSWACVTEVFNVAKVIKAILHDLNVKDTSERYDADSVLEGLRTHENLNELRLVCNRRTSKLPRWLEDSSFTKLTKLEIEGVVIRCEQNNLAGLGKLPALKYLKMQNVDVKKVGREWYYGNSSNDVVAGGIKMAFPKLEQLQFIYMPELEEWELMLEFDGDVKIMPHLSDLRLQNCPKLERLPHHLVNAPLTNLELSGCHRLKGTRCSSSFPHLEKFTLKDSSEFLSSGLPHLPKLKEFFIGRIRNETLSNKGWELLLVLQQLKIEDCIELKSLPNGLTQLPSLRDLRIHRCDKIDSLPEGLGQLRKLQSLVLYSLQSLTYLSDSLGQLESLESLNILCLKNLKLLPEGLRQLKKLQSLKLYGLGLLTYLPNSFGQLESLEHLDIYDLKNLQLLPETLQQLKKLKSLHIRNAEALTCLPDSLAQLELLEKLHISGLKKLKSLPKGIGELKKLKSLRINDTEALICLPNSLAQLESLEQLDISGLKKLKSLPEGLGQLKKLKSFEISNAEALSCLPNSLAQLESLEQLDISALKKLKLLPERLEQLKKLKSLKISDAEELICLPDSLGQLESLEYFEIIGLAKLESLPHSLIQLKKLKALTIENIEALINIPKSLRQLESLETLTISQCQKLKSLPCQFGRLESLIIGPLQAMTCLSNTLEQVNSLKELRICGLKELESLPCWLVQLKALRELHIFDCLALRSLPYWLKDLPLLQELYVRGCPQLSEKYKKEGGDDWPKILQIPIIKIDGRRI